MSMTMLTRLLGLHSSLVMPVALLSVLVVLLVSTSSPAAALDVGLGGGSSSGSGGLFDIARRVPQMVRTQQRQTLPRSVSFERRAGSMESSQVLMRRQDYITAEDRTNPVQAAKDVQAIPYLANNASGVTDTAHQLVQGDSDEAQLSWNAAVGAPFIQTASTNASAAGGWEALPQVEGFTLNRTWELVPGAIMPFYSTAGIDPSAVKRALITFPGKPRDAWKYANLYRNALAAAYFNQSFGLTNNSIMIFSPIWLNELDQQAGSVQPKELYFHGSEWEAGGASRGPALQKSLTTYSIVDNFTDMLFNKNLYPNLNQVVIAGHSMGGQASHRYAVLKKQKAYDPNMSFWVGNPGSWTYLNAERPYNNASCTATFNAWHYGLGQNITKIPKYARDDVKADVNEVVQRYINRKIHMALGLLDNGAGDTHCEARDQGGNHLDRGSQYILHLASVNNGTFPPSQTVDFIGNTSHQDFAMMSSNQSLYWLFANDYNTRYPDIVPHNPGAKTHNGTHAPKPKSYATRGNTVLASALLGGSLVLIIGFFTALPFVFRPNFDEQAFASETKARYGALYGGSSPGGAFAFQKFDSSSSKTGMVQTNSRTALNRAHTQDYAMAPR